MNLFKGCYQDHAKVVDGKLILSLPNATTPVVWQMDLNQAKTSALEVNDNKKDGFALVMKTPKGETIEIAPFARREQAVHSLMAASKALSRAHGQINVQNSAAANTAANPQPIITGPQRKSGWLKKIGFIALGLFIIFLMVNYLASLSPRAPSGMAPRGLMDDTSSIDTGPAPADAPPASGVAVPADEFLKRR